MKKLMMLFILAAIGFIALVYFGIVNVSVNPDKMKEAQDKLQVEVDKAKSRASSAGNQALDKGKEEAGKVVEKGKEEMSKAVEKGTDAAKDAAKDAVKKAIDEKLAPNEKPKDPLAPETK